MSSSSSRGVWCVNQHCSAEYCSQRIRGKIIYQRKMLNYLLTWYRFSSHWFFFFLPNSLFVFFSFRKIVYFFFPKIVFPVPVFLPNSFSFRIVFFLLKIVFLSFLWLLFLPKSSFLLRVFFLPKYYYLFSIVVFF